MSCKSPVRFTAISLACGLLFAAAVPCAADAPRQDKIQSSLRLLVSKFDVVQQRMGAAQAVDLQERLNNDFGAMVEDEPPPTYPLADWNQRLNGLAELDASIVDQVIAGKSDAIAGSHGLVERLIVSRKDGTLQPFALYVPKSVSSNPTLAILLHGRPQTETEVLSAPYFQTLADSTGTIVAAPYGRAIYDFAPPADDEVYQVADEVATAFHIPPQRTYLVGYSMGGFSVFKVGPEHPDRWQAIMSIAGSVLNSESDAVRSAFAHTRVYVVTGSLDDSIPTMYPQGTAHYLAGVGISTGLYVEPSGTHLLASLMPSLTNAWHDMLGGHIRLSAVPRRDTGLPNAPPPPTLMGGRP